MPPEKTEEFQMDPWAVEAQSARSPMSLSSFQMDPWAVEALITKLCVYYIKGFRWTLGRLKLGGPIEDSQFPLVSDGPLGG